MKKKYLVERLERVVYVDPAFVKKAGILDTEDCELYDRLLEKYPSFEFKVKDLNKSNKQTYKGLRIEVMQAFIIQHEETPEKYNPKLAELNKAMADGLMMDAKYSFAKSWFIKNYGNAFNGSNLHNFCSIGRILICDIRDRNSILFRQCNSIAILRLDIPNYTYIKNAVYPANVSGTCGYTAACLILNYWHNVEGDVIDSEFLDSDGDLLIGEDDYTLQDKLLSYGGSNSSWGLTIRDVLIDYCTEYGIAATSTYYVTNFDIFAEIGRDRPVIVFGYFPDTPTQVQSRGSVFHAVTAYGTSTTGIISKLIVHYGWSGYSHVTLDGGLVGSSTQFVLN